MKTLYFSYNLLYRIAVLFLAGMSVFGVEAQTITDVSGLEIKHRKSFLAAKADGGLSFPHEFLQSGQGMMQKEVNGETIEIQNTSTYRMTRYVKQGVAVPLYLTTSQSTGSASPQHTYQRWYNYDTELPLENGVSCDLSKGNFSVLKYKNGLVMGSHIKGGANDANHYAGFNFWGILPTSMTRLNIGADLTSYKDWSYVNSGANVTAANAGNMTEPSLTLRHIYELVDAKVMADELVTKTGDNWLEEHVIHFPRISTLVFETSNNGSNFVPLNLELENYWFYKGNGTRSDENLQNLGDENYVEVTYSKSSTTMTVSDVELRDAPNTNVNGVTGSTKSRRRLIGFKYNTVPINSKLTIMVRSKDPNNTSRKYNVAKFTIIFDENSEVVPYMDVVPEDAAKHSRSTQVLREACHGADPVAHIDFDFPHTPHYVSPSGGIHFYNSDPAGNTTYTHSSALPIAFEKTSYAYSPIADAGTVYNYCVWGSYAIVDYVNQGGTLYPASTVTGDDLDNNSSNEGFLYIDASDMPGTVASVPFEGTFCMGTKMMCSGWMSSVTNSVPGSVILKVIGKRPDDTEEEIYAFCPGQIGKSYRSAGATTTASQSNMVWQQFYFEFFIQEPCVSYELKVENNCVSTSGGDYFLDDIWVFAQLPVVGPEMTTPLCGGSLDVVQLETNFESLLLATGKQSGATSHETADYGYLSFIYLDWDNFLQEFKDGLASLGINVTAHDLQENINSGVYNGDDYREIYRTAFSHSILKTDSESGNKVIYGNFQWSSYYEDHPEFSFAAMALDGDNTVYRMTTDTGTKRLIFNGSMGINQWEFYHNYALLTILLERPMSEIEAEDLDFTSFWFNVLNECSNRSILWFAPKIEIMGTVGGISIDQLEFCENTTQTFAMELAGYVRAPEYEDEDGTHHPGDYVLMHDVYFDWWMGIPKSDSNPDGVPATVENYLQQYTTCILDDQYGNPILDDEGHEIIRDLYLFEAVRCFRFMNPDITDISDIEHIRFGKNPLYQDIPAFTPKMYEYLLSLADPQDGSNPQLHIHSQLVDVRVDEGNVFQEIYLDEPVKYVRFVAIPIESNLNTGVTNFVYICAQPQPFKVKVSNHAPQMTVGYSDKHYPSNLGTLSIRISKSQFEKLVDNGNGYKELHIPLRDINVISPYCIGVKKGNTDNLKYVRISGSSDALMQEYITNNMTYVEGGGSYPPIAGEIDYLVGRDDINWSDGHPETERLLKIHFHDNFQVREGYSYTLRYYFIEDVTQGLTTTCEGNADIIIKIVPDYEVWTGGAENTDWSNDNNWRRADYDELYAGNGVHLKDSYLPNGKEGDNPEETNFITPLDRERRQGFAPLYCTNILMMTDERKDASTLYDDGDEVIDGEKTGFPALRSTSSPLIRYDFQAHEWVQDSIDAHPSMTYRDIGDMVTELYKSNVCDSIAFQSETELINAHLLNYKKAWVEFALPKNKWHLVSSPLQGTISGEWYAPTWSARQETTYFEPIDFNVKPVASITSSSGTYDLDYDRFAPAVYQRQWDKAKAVLYERGAVWSAEDASQTGNLGWEQQGDWLSEGNQGTGQGYSWDYSNADEYLNRLVYKPFGISKVNVAVRGSWSGAHNDHTVPYDNGGFSVMPINNLKTYNDESVKTIFRLPKDDQYYDIWDWGKDYGVQRRVRVYINDGRDWPNNLAELVQGDMGNYSGQTDPEAYMPNETNVITLENRGRLRSDYFAKPSPEEVEAHVGNTAAANLTKYDLDKDGDIDFDDVSIATESTVYKVTLKNEGKGSMGYFLASNPFICGLDMEKFFEKNEDVVYPYYLVLKGSDVDPQNSSLTDTYLATQPEGTVWKWTDMNFSGISNGTNLLGRKVVPPRYAFFLKKIQGVDDTQETMSQVTLKYTADMMAKTTRAADGTPQGAPPFLRIIAERDGDTSEATVMLSPDASNKFLPEEDLETFVVSDISSKIPVIYTLTGRLATSINRIHDFMVLPIGIESNSNKLVNVTFQGVESLGDSLMIYDAKTEELLPIQSGTIMRMPGRTQNRFFIVQGANLQEAIDESNLQIFANGGVITVASASDKAIKEVRVFDAGGREVYVATPNRIEHSFSLSNGIYVVKANTDSAQQVKKINN